jgi:indole-3-glycerol phosphate synthase
MSGLNHDQIAETSPRFNDAGNPAGNVNILRQLAEEAKRRVAMAKREHPLEEVRERALALDADRSLATGFPFEQALSGKRAVSSKVAPENREGAKTDSIHFICECKKASPSKGLIAPEFPYLSIAKEYERAGAACISVLTEPKWFLGKDVYLKEIASEVDVPCIRKDFTVDEYMIYEAKLVGAAAVLLICALLDVDTMKRYIAICDRLGLSALVEAHNEAEVKMAAAAGARIIGVNNRNLRDFTVDIHNSERLKRFAPEGTLFVAESGIRTAEDVQVLRDGGVSGILIGEQLMRAENKVEELRRLRGW